MKKIILSFMFLSSICCVATAQTNFSDENDFVYFMGYVLSDSESANVSSTDSYISRFNSYEIEWQTYYDYVPDCDNTDSVYVMGYIPSDSESANVSGTDSYISRFNSYEIEWQTYTCQGATGYEIEEPEMTLSDYNSDAIELDVTINVFPNPASNHFTFAYSIPEQFQSAQLKFFNLQGVEIGTYNLKSKQGKKEIDVRELTNGVYFYSVIKDGVVTDAKGKVVVMH